MTAEEEEVSLVVEGDDLSSTELGKRREELTEHASNSVTEQRREAVEDELGRVGSGASMFLELAGVVSLLLT
jgi:hypothetical protein